MLVLGRISSEDSGKNYGNGQPIYDVFFTPEATVENQDQPHLTLVKGRKKKIGYGHTWYK